MFTYLFIHSLLLFCFYSSQKKEDPPHPLAYYKYPASEVDLIDTLAVLSHQSFIEMNITSLFCFFFHCGFIVPHLLQGVSGQHSPFTYSTIIARNLQLKETDLITVHVIYQLVHFKVEEEDRSTFWEMNLHSVNNFTKSLYIKMLHFIYFYYYLN